MIGTGNDKICAVMKHRLNFSLPCFIKKMLILKKNGLKKDYKGLTLVRSAPASKTVTLHALPEYHVLFSL